MQLIIANNERRMNLRNAFRKNKVYLDNITLLVFHTYKYFANMIAAFLLAVVKKAVRSSSLSLNSDLASKSAFDVKLDLVVLVIFCEECSDVILPLYWLLISFIFFPFFKKFTLRPQRYYFFLRQARKVTIKKQLGTARVLSLWIGTARALYLLQLPILARKGNHRRYGAPAVPLKQGIPPPYTQAMN